MSLIVPDKVIAASGETTIRQYKCVKLVSTLSSFSANATVAVTNRRVIMYADSGAGKKAEILQNEIYIDNIAGFSFFKGKALPRTGVKSRFFALFAIMAILSAVVFLMNGSIYGFLQTFMPVYQNTVFKVWTTGVPIAIFFIVLLCHKLFSGKITMNMVIHSKGFQNANINIQGADTEQILSALCVLPHNKETQRMFSEISSIVLDVQRLGDKEVLQHLDTEASIVKAK